ncbi:glutamine amidotransferase [Bordetella ansorpii]|uniref:Glutamine amidotransferase n=1 Tax=Bordetella ansorpii TaxID=288768 RepID=A0A157LZ27_9BORD|nr:glutamine amidotransferase [Bordetella ansorpii]SAI02132.1 glutamine amidotransferase [Bordetella ansorpii]
MTASLTASALPVLILHTGDPNDTLRARHGGYGEQLRAAAGLAPEQAEIVPVFRDGRPRDPSAYRAALITGSPAMVTDHEPWSEETAQWLRGAAAAGLPMFGVCYGHQLLAYALGGEVGDNPAGREVGTQAITLTEAGLNDALLQGMPESFPAQTVHMQTLLRLTDDAQVLARSAMDPHQLVRWTPTCYSAQFHPEFGPAFIREHLAYYAEPYGREGIDAQARAQAVGDTPQAGTLLRRFLQTCAAA